MVNENGKSHWNRPHRPSYFGPILLIAIGLIFLAKNIGLIPGEGWGTIWRLWPVLLIVAGVDDLFRREGVAWPILMIGVGVFLLVNYFGPQAWISWTRIIQLWPILLIAVGIDILFKGQSSWMSLVGVFLALVLVGGAIWFVGQGVEVVANYEQIKEIYSSEIEAASLDFSLDVGELIISGEGDEGVLIRGSITPVDKKADLDVKDSLAAYTLKNTSPAFFPHTARWDLDLYPDLPSELRVNNGVGDLILELELMDLESLSANQGVGRMVLHLPEHSAESLLVKQGVGYVQIQVPAGAQIAVDAQNGLSKVDFPAGFELEDGYYVTPGTSPSNADLMITVEQGVGVVDFEYIR